MIIDQQNVGTFSDDKCLSTTAFILFHMDRQSISSFEHLFFQTFLLINSFFSVLTLEYSAIYVLTNLFPIFWVLFVGASYAVNAVYRE